MRTAPSWSCGAYGRQFMIALPNDALHSVWREAGTLGATRPHHRLQRLWGNRRQHFRRVNGIMYSYGNSDPWLDAAMIRAAWAAPFPRRLE